MFSIFPFALVLRLYELFENCTFTMLLLLTNFIVCFCTFKAIVYPFSKGAFLASEFCIEIYRILRNA